MPISRPVPLSRRAARWLSPVTAAAFVFALATPPTLAAEHPAAAPARSSLAGRIVVLDPGHQLGNARYPAQINRLVSAGPFQKACNTTGTATSGGYPEATFTWRVALRLRARLQAAGATVLLTRKSNRADRWGPCIDVRGRAGNAEGADLKISIHGDGSYTAGARGFHVIAPASVRGWTDDIAGPSAAIAGLVKQSLLAAKFPVANYIAGGDGLDFRSDLGTLNLSDVPTVMVELGNMRSPSDAAAMTSASGQQRYADALFAAANSWLGG